jgi:hypothetical protein
MSRKDYQMLAIVFGKTLARHAGEGEERAIWDAVHLFEEQALLDNPRFDIFKFEIAIREEEFSSRARV